MNTNKQNKLIYGVFENRKQANEYIQRILNEYDSTMLTVEEILDREKRKGYVLHKTQLYRAIKKARLSIRGYTRRKDTKEKKFVNLSITKELAELIDSYPYPRSTFIERVLRCVLGMPSPNFMLAYFAPTKPALFTFHDGELYASISTKFTDNERQMIKALLEMARLSDEPVQYIKTYTTNAGLNFLGGS